jgi:dolichol-phosphate mannosyltransferase
MSEPNPTLHSPAAALPRVEVSIIVPTFNESQNIVELVRRVSACMEGERWEIVFVDDDSPDSTAAEVRRLASRHPNVRVLHRVGRRGLSSACLEGMLSSSAPFVAVIDADMQHDERILPEMLKLLRTRDVDVVVGSRYTAGGGIGQWDRKRALISRAATKLARAVVRADLTDPMSGFFMMRFDAMLVAVKNGVSGIGFKILLDLFASSPTPLRFLEVPYTFRDRFAGESKLDSRVAWDYMMLLLDKLIGHILPIRFIIFSLVGGVGVLVHLGTLSLFFKGLGWDFLTAQAITTLVAMTFNYLGNNILTYRDMRLRGWSLLKGWVSFAVMCGVGAVANVGVSSYLFERGMFWILAAVCGVIVGAVWNYALTSVYTWKATTRR